MMNVQNSEKLQEKFRFDTVQYDHPKEDKPMNKKVLGTLYDVIDDCFLSQKKCILERILKETTTGGKAPAISPRSMTISGALMERP